MTDNDWLSKYKFLQPIGNGGMGQVFLVEDRANGNATRVIKQLINRSAGGEFENTESVRLFKREAEILRDLDHHGIVKVHDYHASPDGRYFLVMDYVPGRNLEAVITSNGPLSSELVVRIAIHCCDVLDYMHSQREPIIYRDLKPSNLMLTPDGRIIFIDFGIARQFMPKEVATRVVTAGYSPPEQYFGKPDPRSDIYSLGATLSHLLTGVRPKPLTGCNPASINPSVMASLNDLIRNMTAHDVDQRPASAHAVRHALYKIYQEVHPEFEIPYEPERPAFVATAGLPGRHIVSSGADDPFSSATMRALNQPLPGGRTSGVPADGAYQQPGAEPHSIVEKVKRWFESTLRRYQ